MRLCRFRLDDDVTLIGFYLDDRVVSIDQATDVYCQEVGVELLLPSTEEILDLLPPDGLYHLAAWELSRWIDALDAEGLAELAIPIEDVQILVPIPQPGKVLLLAGNYAAHVVERGGVTAEREETFPWVFSKPPATTLTNHGDPIVIPGVSPDHVDWECELGVVIGKRCKGVTEAEALGYVAGYTVINDVSDRKFQPNPGRKPRERDKFFDWLHGKWHDTFLPMGPAILSAEDVADPQALHLTLAVNGETKQDGSTGQMVFPVAAIIEFLSGFMTLEPGDVISTGTPSGVGSSTGTYLKPGDLVEATIDGIGTLVNPVVAEGDPEDE